MLRQRDVEFGFVRSVGLSTSMGVQECRVGCDWQLKPDGNVAELRRGRRVTESSGYSLWCIRGDTDGQRSQQRSSCCIIHAAVGSAEDFVVGGAHVDGVYGANGGTDGLQGEPTRMVER